MPRSVQHVEEEPVQDGPFAPGTVDHHVSGLQDAECRPSHEDCAARSKTTRFYAEQRLGSGRCAVRRKREVPLVQRRRSGSPLGTLVVLVLFGCYPGTCHNPQSRGEEERFQLRQLIDCVMDKPNMFSYEHTIKTKLFKRVISDILSVAHALFWVQSFPLGSPCVATFSITVPGLSRGFASAMRVLCSDWMTPLLIPVSGEPIRAQLLWLHVHSCSLRANLNRTP